MRVTVMVVTAVIMSGVIVPVRVPFDFHIARHDENSPADPQDLDLGAVET